MNYPAKILHIFLFSLGVNVWGLGLVCYGYFLET